MAGAAAANVGSVMFTADVKEAEHRFFYLFRSGNLILMSFFAVL